MQRSVNVFVCTSACACVLQEPEDTQTPTILLIAYFYERSYKILFFNNSFLILKIAITLQDLLGMWSSNKDYIILIFLIVR